MKTLLLTGFAPFGGETCNPSWEAVRTLPETVGEYTLVKHRLPVVFEEAARETLALAAQRKPDVILCVGQAGGRGSVTPERIAINLREASIPDNAGNQPQGQKILPQGPDGIFATVPVEAMAQAICQAGLPGQVSNTAGTFVCNELMYQLLASCQGTGTRVGFIHVPYLPEQAPEGKPSLPLEAIQKALIAAICAL